MKIIKYLTILFLGLYLFSCNTSVETKKPGNVFIDSLVTDTVSVNPFIDSLKSRLTLVTETQQIDILNRLAEEYRNVSPAFQKKLWKEALRWSENISYKIGIADALHNEGISFYKQLKFDSATISLKKSLDIAESTGDKRAIALALSWTAEIQRASQNKGEAEKIYNEALKLAESNGDQMRQAFCLTYLAAIHVDRLEYEAVRSICRRAMVAARKAGYNNLIAVNNGFIADTYKYEGKYDSAKYYYAKVVDISWETKNYNSHAFNATNLGEIYRMEMNFSKALDYYNKALKSAGILNDKWRISYINTSIGECYRELQNDYKKAKEYYYEGIRISEEGHDDRNYVFAAVTLVYALKDESKFEEAEKIMIKVDEAHKRVRKRYDEALIPEVYGNLYLSEGKLEKAAKYFKIALDSATQMKEENIRISSLGYLCKTYLKLGRVKDIVPYEKEIRQLIKTLTNKAKIKGLSVVIAEYYQKTENYKEAFNMEALTLQLNDSINNSSSMKKFAASEFKAKEEKLRADQTAREAVFKVDQLKKEEELKRQKTIRYSFTIAFILVTISLFFVFKNYREKKMANAELATKNELIERQKEIVEEKQKAIVDSINYAKRIQQTLLAHDNFLQDNLLEHFVLFKPKDIVSGDFYWATLDENRFYLAVCDSTGHGVPGAFMSLMNINFMNEAINEKKIKKPNEVFNHIRQSLIQNISQDGQKDGMDGILVCFEQGKMNYASANNAPLVISEGKIIELTKDKMPVGMGERVASFSLHELNAKKGDLVYLYTDGFADQFGGEKGKKFKYKQLNELLLSVSQLPMAEQKQKLETVFNQWKGNLEQVDDVCIVGIRI